MPEIIGGSTEKNPEEFYKSLKENLTKTHNFPEDYLFKFIIPNDSAKLTDIYRVFDDAKATVSTKESKNGKYISVSIQVFVLDADHVIRLYKEVAKIDEVIML